MKFSSVNIQGLGGRAKKLSLHLIVDINHPDILMIQESMGVCDSFIYELVKLFPGWEFVGVKFVGHSECLVTRWSMKCKLFISFSICLGILTKIFSMELDHIFVVLYLYGPYDENERFWSRLFEM
jgi:exonuclease III